MGTLYSFSQYLHNNLTLAAALISVVFAAVTVRLFGGGWRREDRPGKLALTLGLSPILYILFCRLVDFSIYQLLRAMGFGADGSLFFIIRVGADTLLHAGVLYLCLRAYRELTGAGAVLSAVVYTAFMTVTVVAVNMPTALFKTLTALALLGFMLWLLMNEFRFMRDHDTEPKRRHILLPLALSLVTVVGVMGEEFVLAGEIAGTGEALRSTQGWVCVFGFMFAVMTFLLEKNIVRGARETYETEWSIREIGKLNTELAETQDKLIQAFSELLEGKSGQSGNHVKRVAAYSEVITRAMGLDDETAHRIGVAAMMHDCGKLMIPNEILEKPGRLTDDEFETMKQHVAYGEKMLAGVPGSVMEEALLIAGQHHERWDGKGYLKHLAGDEIALSSQIVSVADVFDALTSKRSYKDAWDPREAVDEIVRNRGTQFSPAAVDAFEKCRDDCLRIMAEFRDE